MFVSFCCGGFAHPVPVRVVVASSIVPMYSMLCFLVFIVCYCARQILFSLLFCYVCLGFDVDC